MTGRVSGSPDACLPGFSLNARDFGLLPKRGEFRVVSIIGRPGAAGSDRDARGLQLFLLSSFRVLRDGQPIDGALSGKTRQLLKILAANHRRCVPKDQLIEMLWPEGDPSSGATSLKVAAHKLRSNLDPDKANGDPGPWVLAENGTYHLSHEASIWIDTEAFREHCRRGRALQAEGRIEEARREFEQAEALYTGDYLEEDMYEDWTLLRREELKDLHLDVLQRLAQLAMDRDSHADVIRYCHKIVLGDPCREDAYRMLMTSHAALNQYARAGAWYAVCRVTLAREVDSAPSPETVEAFEQLFREKSLRLPRS